MRKHSNLVKLIRDAQTILIIGHQNADPDAVCSAYAFSKLINAINHKAKVSFSSPDGVSKLSKQLLQTIPLQVIEEFDVSQIDLIVTVDTNTLQQLGKLQATVMQAHKPLMMIDHHALHPENAKTAIHILCDDKSTSTCEIILELYMDLKIPIDEVVSQALLTGIIVETGHFSIATKRTIKSACTLIDRGADPAVALALTKQVMDESERIARMKSAQRVRLEKIDNWLIALSDIGSYHASAARSLISLGAHVAVVAGKRNDQLTVSMRSTHEFFQQTGLHLGTNLASPLGQRLGGMGGGHATAAGTNAKGEVGDALKQALKLLREFLTHPEKSIRDVNNPSTIT